MDVLLRVQPGLRLEDLNNMLQRRWFPSENWDEESQEALLLLQKAVLQCWPPDPTETTCTVGGMFACNAAGIRNLYYRAERELTFRHSLCDCGWTALSIDRGECVREGNQCQTPLGVLNTWSPLAEGCDLIDLLAGSEGTLAVITELTLALQAQPSQLFGVLFGFEDEDCALLFAEKISEHSVEGCALAALEYYDQMALDFVSIMGEESAQKLPDLSDNLSSAVYLEIVADSIDYAEGYLFTLLEDFSELGGKEEDTYAAFNAAEIEPFVHMRHAVPEMINRQIDIHRQKHPEIMKLGTDFTLAMKTPKELLAFYRAGIHNCGVEGVIFGHLGEGHLHVNLLPDDVQALERAREQIIRWTQEVCAMGGNVVSENGVGKLKKELLAMRLSESDLNELLAVKAFFDPETLLCPGNVYPSP